LQVAAAPDEQELLRPQAAAKACHDPRKHFNQGVLFPSVTHTTHWAAARQAASWTECSCMSAPCKGMSYTGSQASATLGTTVLHTALSLSLVSWMKG